MDSDSSRRLLSDSIPESNQLWHEWQSQQTKSFVQWSAESYNRNFRATQERLIFWLCLIATVALASARLWIGVGVLLLLLVLERWWSWHVEKVAHRLERFRQRFRDLKATTEAEGIESFGEVTKFLRKFEDSILYPFAVPEYDRERPDGEELEHIYTLSREYCSEHSHSTRRSIFFRAGRMIGTAVRAVGISKGNPIPADTCVLCEAAERVRKHIKDVLANVETSIKTARQVLVAQIDASNPEGAIATREFANDFRAWLGPLDAGTELHTLVEWLRDKDRWTFDEADKVLDACLKMSTPLSIDERLDRIRTNLSREIESAANRCGVGKLWHWYAYNRPLQNKDVFKVIRRIIGRSNPEAMFRELMAVYENYSGPEGLNYGTLRFLESLKEFGYDTAFIRRQVAAARKMIAKDRNRQRELQAAQAFASGEELLYARGPRSVGWSVVLIFVLAAVAVDGWYRPELVASVGERNVQIVEDIIEGICGALILSWLAIAGVLRARLWWRSGRPLPKFRWL